MYSQLSNVSKSLGAAQQSQLTEAMQQQNNIQRGLENASKVQQTQTEKTDTALVNKDGSNGGSFSGRNKNSSQNNNSSEYKDSDSQKHTGSSPYVGTIIDITR
jgi:hypothetical protein